MRIEIAFLIAYKPCNRNADPSTHRLVSTPTAISDEVLRLTKDKDLVIMDHKCLDFVVENAQDFREIETFYIPVGEIDSTVDEIVGTITVQRLRIRE
jgi:hypothetical protein